VVRTLRQAGYEGNEIVEAEDGAQALAMATADVPDLILSDWNMPNMSGIEFLRALRARGAAVPFCFVTSEGSDEMRTLAEQAGAVGLIAKPFTAEAFSDVLKSVVSA
jgi:two-component system chemotaxis response regulator CheY